MKNLIAKSMLSLAAGAGMFAIPTTAKADHGRVEVRVDRHEEHFGHRRIWIEPVYEERATQVWVEPVYEVRDVVRFEHGRRCVSHERVLVRAGGWQNVEKRVCVPAHYRNEDRQVLVTPGHFETQTTRVCVREGRWDGAVSFGFGLHF